ncbi:MAG: helix-turn-helix domain-containing protein [Promethearchaeota archaeon]
MSLKEFTKEIFTRYGFTEDDINVYLIYLKVPRATISEVFMTLEEIYEYEYAKVEEITENLVEKGFLKKVEGMVPRYIPLEPYFGLFTKESELFREEISKIKDAILADQSSRFEKLESIQNKSLTEVDTAVKNQINDFFQDSDSKNENKKNRIDSATTRFTDTNKTLESDLHANIEKDFAELKNDIEQLDNELTGIKDDQNSQSKTLEANTHTIHDGLNANLKSISQSFVSENETSINNRKSNLEKLISDLLSDFGNRVSDLDSELKKDLDEHVERHKDIANDLKPRMEQILEKYLERMNKVVEDLKDKISRLLAEHKTHVKGTTDTLQIDLKSLVDERHRTLIEQCNTFRENSKTLVNNLIEQANRFSDFSEDMAKKGFFWAGKKKKYKARHEITIRDVIQITESLRPNFNTITEDYVQNTKETTEAIKSDVTGVMTKENDSLATETSDLNKKAQETLDAQLASLATDMSTEIDNTLQSGVKDCSDTSLKLKDSLENSLKTHHSQYEGAINTHKNDSLSHYTDFDNDIKNKNTNWVKEVDQKFNEAKNNITTEITNQINKLNEYKAKHEKLINDRQAKIRADFDKSKKITSEKINAEIKFWDNEAAQMNDNLSNMLEDHKTKYQNNALNLQKSLDNTTKDTIQNVKDAIADFTLQFMNSIDDANELAENNESKLNDIHQASSNIPEIAEVTTWPVVGRDALLGVIKDAIYRVKSSIIVVTPVVEPDILQTISQYAFQKKAVRFMLTSHFDLNQYGDIINKMKVLGNIQFRQLTSSGEFYAVTRDAEEVILAPYTQKESDLVAIVSNQEGYSKLYSQFIGPIFLANSRPLK